MNHVLTILLISSTLTKCDIWNQQLPELPISIKDKAIKVQENVTELQIQNLDGTLRYETLSKLYTVSKLKIFNSHITFIEHGALCSPPKLQSLYLNFAANSEAPNLTKDTFRLCPAQLQELFLRFDFVKPSKIESDALENLTLKSLGVQCYPIKQLKKNFFKMKEESLKQLVVSFCHLQSVDSDVFEDMVELEEVEISHNRRLEEIPDNLFSKNLKLKRLWLQHNRIRELKWEDFEELVFLEDLNLSGNRLSHFSPVTLFQNVPNLKRLEIKKNLWPCPLKKKFSEELEKRLNHSVEVIYFTDACRE